MPRLPPHTIRAGRKFQVRLVVPKKFRARVGKSIVSAMLDTESLTEAKRLYPIALLKLRAIITKAEGTPDPLMRALEIASLLGPAQQPSDAAERREKATGALGYARVEAGLAVPLMAFRDEWLAQSKLNRRSLEKARQSLNDLAAWLRSRNLPLLFETIDRKAAYEYRDSELAKRHPGTANSLLSGLRSYWSWAIDRDRIGDRDNHWRAVKSFSKRNSQSDRQRAFRDEELKALFAHKDGSAEQLRQQLLPLMSVALASGARLSELCGLRVRDVLTGKALKHKCDDLDIAHGDCPHGAFFFRVDHEQGKTPAAERLTPIHSDIAGLIAKLIDGKKPDDLLFRDDRVKRKGSTGRPFSFSLTQRFERYRQAVGVHDRENGRERSRVTFHSFRHTFIDTRTKALADGASGFNTYVLADVVGHARGGMALPMTGSVYSGPATMTTRTACVESVRAVPMTE
jgi:integrase